MKGEPGKKGAWRTGCAFLSLGRSEALRPWPGVKHTAWPASRFLIGPLWR